MARPAKALLNDVDIFNASSVRRGKSFADSSDSNKLRKYFVELEKKGYKRVLMTVGTESIAKVERLYDSFPNFSGVIDFVVQNMKFSAMSKPDYIRIPPIALGGKPGIGKTHFCRELSASMNLEMEFISCSSNNAEFSISGLDSGYSNAGPGKISEFFTTNETANPVIVLDEFEKPSAISRGSNSTETFHGAFLTLLETSSAMLFMDNFSKVKLDTSYISWIATVNDFSLLPEPIQSRLTYFEIDDPSQEERVKVCNSIYEKLRVELVKKRQIIFEDKLEDDVVNFLAIQNPREIRKALEQEMMKTVAKEYQTGITRKSSEKIRFKIRTCDLDVYTPPEVKDTNKGIGFLANVS